MLADFSRNEKYGVAIFNSMVDLKEGWACVEGESPFYISGTGDLYSDVIWFTNIDLTTFIKTGLNRTPRIRPDNYLRTRFSSLIIELGLRYYSTKFQAEYLSTLFGRIMDYANLHLGIDLAPATSLNSGIRQACFPEENPISNATKSAAEAAFQPHTICERHTDNENIDLISLVFHRTTYARSILSTELPIGNWKPVDSLILKQSDYQIMEWVKNCDLPLLVKVKIVSVNKDINHLVNYGAGAGFKAARSGSGNEVITYNVRAWMTKPEYLFFLEYSDLKIENMLVSEGYGICPVSIPDWSSATEGSFAFGLYCENLWTSLTRTIDGRAAKNPIGAWIHSVDRVNCLKKSVELSMEPDVNIHSYGYGRITLEVPKGCAGLIPDLALKVKMISPMVHPDQARARQIPDKIMPSELFQLVMERHSLEFFNQADEKVHDQALNQYEAVANNTNRNLVAI